MSEINFNRKLRSIITLIIVGLVLFGCTVGMAEYYSPEGNQITFKPRQCGQTGGADLAVINLGEVKVSSYIRKSPTLILYIEIQVPAGNAVKLGNIYIEENDNVLNIPKEISIRKITPNSFHSDEKTLLDSLAGYTEERSGLLSDINAFYKITYPIPIISVENLVLIFEGITVNGTVQPKRNIKFQLKNSVVINSINC